MYALCRKDVHTSRSLENTQTIMAQFMGNNCRNIKTTNKNINLIVICLHTQTFYLIEYMSAVTNNSLLNVRQLRHEK